MMKQVEVWAWSVPAVSKSVGPTAVVRMKVAVSSRDLMGELQPCPRGAWVTQGAAGGGLSGRGGRVIWEVLTHRPILVRLCSDRPAHTQRPRARLHPEHMQTEPVRAGPASPCGRPATWKHPGQTCPRGAGRTSWHRRQEERSLGQSVGTDGAGRQLTREEFEGLVPSPWGSGAG